MTTDYRDALLADDLVTAWHAHHGPDRLVANLPDGSRRSLTPAQAGSLTSTMRPGTELTDTEFAADGPRRVSRRHILAGATAGLGALLAAGATPRMAFAAAAPGTVAAATPTATATGAGLTIAIFLRGGMDGLSAVVPVGDPAYYRARPQLAVPAEQTLELTPQFGLNRNLGALLPAWQAGDLGIVVGAGNPWISRSHFEDMSACERGAPASVRSGWLGRHLASSATSQGTFRAVTVGTTAAASLVAPGLDTVAMSTIGSFDVNVWEGFRPQLLSTLDAMYGAAGGQVNAQADATLAAIGGLSDLRGTPYAPAGGAVYPDSPFGRGLADIARIAKSGKGLEVACIDIGDWDMHQNLGSASQDSDWFSRKARDLAQGIAALRTDLGPLWASTTVITMSEFGRRVEENGTGVDHGHGNVMFVAGGRVAGGRIYGSLPSLTPGNLHAGDVPVTTDYRQLLGELVTGPMRNKNVDTVFPGFTLASTGSPTALSIV